MGLTVTEDTPADMLAGNMELLVQLPPRIDEDYENDEIYDGDDDDDRHQHLRNNHRHHNHHHSNGHHTRRNVNGNARRVTVARNTPMMDLLVQVATSQKLSASSYTLEAIGEHGLVLTHHPNTPIGALDALQVKLLPKQGTFVPMKTRHANQPFETTFRLQVHLPRNQLYVSRVSSRMNLGKILDEVCTEKNLDRNNYELRHPANIEEILDLSLSLQDYHLQEVTLCPKRRSMGSSLSSQDIMALQRQEERRRQEAKQSVFGFVFKKSKESSLSTDSLGERSVSPARSDGTGRSSSPQAPPTAPTRPQRKRRPAPKPPMPQPPAVPEINAISNGGKTETEKDERIVISHSRNSSDSSGYHEASVLSDNLDSNIRVPETLPRRSKLQTPTPRESPGRTLAESSQASKSLGNLAAVVIPTPRTTIARGNSNSSLVSAGLRKKKAAPPPPQTRPLSSAISTQALERIVDSEESLSSSIVEESEMAKISSDVAVPVKRKLVVPRTSLGNDDQTLEVKPKIDVNREEENIQGEESKSDLSGVENSQFKIDPSISNSEIIVPNVEPASEHKHKRDLGEEYQGSITEAESTSDLLKKVSDTLSGSLRSPTTPTTTIASSLANGDQSPLLETSNAECVDGLKEPGDIGLEIDEAQRFLVANEKLDNNDKDCVKREKESSNFLNDSQPSTIKHSEEQTASLLPTKQNSNSDEDHLSSTTTDWEYLLPEPPTEFRDTNVVANKDVISSNSYEKIIPITAEVAKSNAESKSIEKQATPVVETVKSKKNETVLVSSDESNRSRTSSISFSETGIKLLSDQRRVNRSFTKSAVDSESRRGSQTVSTPSIAPVDNTLSNFVITTYSRPKNVDIFDEIDRTAREPQVIASPKNSTQNLHRPSVVNADSRKNSAISLLKETTPRVVNQEEKSKFSDIISQLEVQKNNNEESVENVNRSDIKISIAAKPRPKSEIIINENVNRSKFIVVNNVTNDSCDSKEENKPIEETIIREQGGGNQKFSQWREDILKKQETPTKEKQLQSLQVLRSILPQLEENRRDSEDPIIVSEKPNSNPSEEPRVETTISNTVATPTEPNLHHAIQKTTSSDEPRVKRYTYAGPPAIDLGSWSDRSRTTKVQIKPDSDYKFEKSRSPELSVKRDAEYSNRENHLIVNNKITTGMTTTVTLNSVKPAADHSTFSPNNVNSNTIMKNQRIVNTKIEKNFVDDKKDVNNSEKNLITRTNVGGIRRPVSMIVGSSSGSITLRSTKDDITMSKLNVEKENLQKQRDGLKEEVDDVDVDVRPRNFKELKEAFAKDQNMNNSITIPKYGTLGRRMENSTTNNKSTTTIVRRDSNVNLNGENVAANLPRKDQTDLENSIKIIKPVQDKRNFVIPAAAATTNRCGLQDVVGTAVRRTSRGNLMPVVKGFKMTVQAEDETTSLSQDKRGGCRVAIGDISNGNYITTQNTLKKTVQAKVVDDFGSNVIPKPPPTMPVITGVTLKSNNLKNSRPKSMPVEPDPRNQLLESIRNFAAGNQLKRIPRRNPNIAGAPGSRSVR